MSAISGSKLVIQICGFPEVMLPYARRDENAIQYTSSSTVAGAHFGCEFESPTP